MRKIKTAFPEVSTGMFKNERHAFIIKQINLHNKVLSSELSRDLKVSEDTVRRDLAELSDAGEIIKVHGGALSKSYHFPIQQNLSYAQAEKNHCEKGNQIDSTRDDASYRGGYNYVGNGSHDSR